jgi:hypothetical protein
VRKTWGFKAAREIIDLLVMKSWFFPFVLVLLFFVFTPGIARADVSLLVLESLGVAGEFTGSGHSAVYLSNICADGPLKLRMCRPGEHGAVIGTYPGYTKNFSQEWIAVPLNAYLYGIENERDIPLYANGKVRTFLREDYRRKHLESIVPAGPNGASPEGTWKLMLTMGFNRDIYSFNIKTTPEEDARFLKDFLSVPHKDGFNSFTANCADFAKKVVNTYFPGAVGRDFINDFGITTPKALAKSITGFAGSRPERLFNIVKYPQVAGPIWRSSDNRNFTEKAMVSKKYIVPALFFDPPVYGILAGAYLLTGRFSVHNTYKKYATPQIAQMNLDRRRAAIESNAAHFVDTPDGGEDAGKSKEAERLKIFGDKKMWEGYKSNFAPLLKNAIDAGLFQDEKEIKTFYRDLEFQSAPAYDANGQLILNVKYYGRDLKLGLTRDNILAADSDPELALKLMLVKINGELKGAAKDRSDLPTFKADWELLRQLSARLAAVTIDKSRGRFLSNPPPETFGRKFEKTFIKVTQ